MKRILSIASIVLVMCGLLGSCKNSAGGGGTPTQKSPFVKIETGAYDL